MATDTKTRYMGSAGLAFAEQGEMKKLGKMSEQGWLLERLAFLGYRLLRGTPHKLDYCLDIRLLDETEKNDYFDIFAAGGWKHVTSEGSFHIFSAEPGTEPIYTDRDTMRDKYTRVGRISRLFTVVMLILTLAVWGLLYISTEIWSSVIARNAAFAALTVCAALLVPSIMVYTAYVWRIRKLKS